MLLIYKLLRISEPRKEMCVINAWSWNMCIRLLLLLSSVSPLCRISTLIETNHVPTEHRVAAILVLLFMVLISLFPALTPLYLYVSTFRSTCAVPNMAVFCSSLISWFPGMFLAYFLNDFEMVPVAPIITAITFVFTFNMRCISIVSPLYFRIFSASYLITFMFPGIATSNNIQVIIIIIIIIIIIMWSLHRVFTNIYLKQTMFLEYIMLQLCCNYTVCYM